MAYQNYSCAPNSLIFQENQTGCFIFRTVSFKRDSHERQTKYPSGNKTFYPSAGANIHRCLVLGDPAQLPA